MLLPRYVLPLAALLFAPCALGGTLDPMSLNPESPWYAINAEPGWHYEVGIGAGVEPTYAGSDDYATEPEVFARALYRTQSGHRWFIALGEIGGMVSLSPQTQLLGFFEYEGGRDPGDDDALTGMDKVDATVEGQLTLAHRFGNTSVFGTLQPDVAGSADKGLVWFVGVSRDWLFADSGWRASARLDLSGANAEYMQTEFGVSEEEAARTAYAVYEPEAGLKSSTLGLSAEYAFTDRFSILTNLESEFYLSDASDSPLIADEGTDMTYELSVLLRWQF